MLVSWLGCALSVNLIKQAIGQQPDVAFTITQRRQFDHRHSKPIKEISPKSTIGDLVNQVPVRGGDHANIYFLDCLLPSRRTSPSCKTLKNLTCAAKGNSPISSRNQSPHRLRSK